MLKCFKKINKKDTGVFAAGLLFGTAGIKLLSSKDAKKLYTNCAAAVLRAKECVLRQQQQSRKMLKISMQKHSRLMKRELQRMQKNIQMLRMQKKLKKQQKKYLRKTRRNNSHEIRCKT